jgi:tol-pal system protein YbgF
MFSVMFVPFPLSQAGKQNAKGGTRIATLLCTVLLTSMIGFPAQTVVASEPRDTSRHLYDRVMVEFQHGDYEAALAGFKFFIELHRKSALAANAQYWIGECQYRLGRYTDALNSFSNVGSYDPMSQKLAASAFKIGQTYSMLGDYYRARLTFDEVLDHYPGGTEAALALKAIQGISLKTGSTPPLSVKNVNNITR